MTASTNSPNEPIQAWGLFLQDPTIKEKRLHGVYLDAADANLDAMTLQNATQFPTVEPFEINTAPLFTSTEPATEAIAEDFDTPIHVPGEIR